MTVFEISLTPMFVIVVFCMISHYAGPWYNGIVIFCVFLGPHWNIILINISSRSFVPNLHTKDLLHLIYILNRASQFQSLLSFPVLMSLICTVVH